MAYIMAIDDDEDMATAAAIVLRDVGHEVRTEHDTKSAITCMEERRLDLAVLDVMIGEDTTAGCMLARTM